MAIGLLELDDLSDGGEKRLCRLVGHHVGMSIAIEAITRKEETVVVTRGCWRDEALVVDR